MPSPDAAIRSCFNARAVLWLRVSFFALLGPGTVLVWVPLGILSSNTERFGLDARSPWLVVWAGAFATAFVAFVPFYEEPRLARQFGQPYEEYKATVPRWLPRRPNGRLDA